LPRKTLQPASSTKSATTASSTTHAFWTNRIALPAVARQTVKRARRAQALPPRRFGRQWTSNPSASSPTSPCQMLVHPCAFATLGPSQIRCSFGGTETCKLSGELCIARRRPNILSIPTQLNTTQCVFIAVWRVLVLGCAIHSNAILGSYGIA